MHQINVTTGREPHGYAEPPIVAELKAIFEAIPADDLIARLVRAGQRGRPNYDPRIMWRCFITYYALGIESVSALIRYLHNNPYVAEACGITADMPFPSQPTFSRFGTRLSRQGVLTRVRDIQRAMTVTLRDRLPHFGETLAMDSTTLKAWSNSNKRGKKGNAWGNKRQRPRIGKVSDGDAGFSVKNDTQGNKKFTWGYKAHILCDAVYELPVVVDVTAGNVHDVKKASSLLRQMRYAFPQNPKYVLADAGYSSFALDRLIRRQYRATPVIDPNRGHKKAVERQAKIANWKALYRSRTSVERVNSRMKAFYKLDSIRVRGRTKVMLHALLSAIALEARAIAFPDAVRRCVTNAA